MKINRTFFVLLAGLAGLLFYFTLETGTASSCQTPIDTGIRYLGIISFFIFVGMLIFRTGSLAIWTKKFKYGTWENFTFFDFILLCMGIYPHDKKYIHKEVKGTMAVLIGWLFVTLGALLFFALYAYNDWRYLACPEM